MTQHTETARRIFDVHFDEFYTTGQRHLKELGTCEDFALTSSTPEGMVIATVADGCSASANSALGAMLNCYFWKAYAEDCDKANSLLDSPNAIEQAYLDVVNSANFNFQLPKIADLDGLPWDATIVSAVYEPREKAVTVAMFGDGAYVVKYEGEKTDIIFVVSVQWLKGAPPYLSYIGDSDRLHALKRLYPNGQPAGVRSQVTFVRNKGSKEYTLATKHDAALSLSDMILYGENGVEQLGLFEQFDLEGPQGTQLYSVSVCSDGALDISRRTEEGILEYLWGSDPSRWLQEFTDYKTLEGSFQRRRAMRAHSTLTKDGFVFQDDFSIATILLKEYKE